jgi:DNA repair protein RecN (Recombination protein N)
MLNLIRIKNYTVIDELELELETGFSVLTGETGAGKSILVDALGLAIGDRAEPGVVRVGAERAEIGVLFECPPEHPSLRWLEERGLDADGACALRRILGADGRSRAFINNQPARLQDLRELGELLADIHGQHAHHSLRHAATQRIILDGHGGHGELAERVAERFAAWRVAEKRLSDRRTGRESREAELELLAFQARELDQLALEPGESQRLRSERERLANVDRLAEGLAAALGPLYEADFGSAHQLLARARQELERLAALDAELEEPATLLAQAEIEMREAATALARYRDRLEPDPRRLEWVEARLDKVRALARRHRVEDDALAEVLPALRERIAELEVGHESLEALAAETDAARRAYLEAAEVLSQARTASAEVLAERVTEELRVLGLPHGRLRVDIERNPIERADASGMDRIDFQVQLNPGQAFGPLGRVASGGELSRISLALEVIGAGASPVPTLVFDEVDSGIGGGVAEIVGARLAALSRHKQVLCVTHLPQVASQGRRHYRVVKLTDGNDSRTEVRALSAEDRVEELSRMLGGVEITARARAHAAEMIERAGAN